MSRDKFRVAAISLALISLGFFSRVSAQAPQTPEVKEFEKQIQDYLKLRQPLSKDVGTLKPTKDSEDIPEHQKAIAQSLRDARKDAKQGDIFTPEVAVEFKRLIAQAMEGVKDHHVRQSLKHSEPVAFTLHVNDSYPAKVPLQSTPPSLLMNLPKLPKELDYRLVGRTLVLRDCGANIVVDLLPNAIPAS